MRNIGEALYRRIILDLRSDSDIGSDFGIAPERVRLIKTGKTLKEFRARLDDYHKDVLDWQFRLELFVKARKRRYKTKATEELALEFLSYNPFPKRSDYE